MHVELNLPETFNAADYFVDRNIREGRGQKTAILCRDNAFTYAQVQAGMNKVGNALKGLGIEWRIESPFCCWIRNSIPCPSSGPSRSGRYQSASTP